MTGTRTTRRLTSRQWEALRALAGKPDFLYVADSKLCSRENMDYIDRRGGRLVTVLPRTPLEDREFRKWVQTHQPTWETVWDRPNPKRKGGLRDRWCVFRAELPSAEAWPVTWVFSALLAIRQDQTRRERIAPLPNNSPISQNAFAVQGHASEKPRRSSERSRRSFGGKRSRATSQFVRPSGKSTTSVR